jgi:hypothetical protein
MTDYRNLSDFEQKKVEKKVLEEIEPKHHINKYNGFEWDEPEYTLNSIKNGRSCSECWRLYHICLCSHY